MLKAAYGMDHIWFSDDIFGLKPGWISRFADLIAQENLQFRFKIQSRVDLLLEENNIEALARAGCDEIWCRCRKRIAKNIGCYGQRHQR